MIGLCGDGEIEMVRIGSSWEIWLQKWYSNYYCCVTCQPKHRGICQKTLIMLMGFHVATELISPTDNGLLFWRSSEYTQIFCGWEWFKPETGIIWRFLHSDQYQAGVAKVWPYTLVLSWTSETKCWIKCKRTDFTALLGQRDHRGKMSLQTHMFQLR